MFLMPPIRSTILERRALFTVSISLNKKIISLYSCCMKKGLVYIIIIALSSRQPSSSLEYTKVNTYSLCDIC